jgi:hypothetical protein
MMQPRNCGELVGVIESKYNPKTEFGFVVDASHPYGQVLLHAFGYEVGGASRHAISVAAYHAVDQISLMR